MMMQTEIRMPGARSMPFLSFAREGDPGGGTAGGKKKAVKKAAKKKTAKKK